MDTIFTFKNTHLVMMAEKVLLRRGVAVSVLPLPAGLSAGCGLCICVQTPEKEIAEQTLRENSLDEFGVYERLKENGKTIYRDTICKETK